MAEGVYTHGLVNLVASDRIVDKPFVDNKRFDLIGGKKWFDKDKCLLSFTEPSTRVEGRYRTLYGYNFAHNGVILDNSVVNLSQSLRRLLAVREPEIEGFDANLRLLQQASLTACKQALIDIFSDFTDTDFPDDMRMSAFKLQFMKHLKKKLRAMTYKQIEASGLIGDEAWLCEVIWKMKLDEWAKNGKFGRIIVDLGVAASLQGAMYAEKCKHILGDRDILYKGCVFHFVTQPSPDRLRYVFDTLQNMRGDLTMFVFSDDACCAIRTADGVRIFNLDFSSCDISHTPGLFDALFMLFKTPAEIVKAYHLQMAADIKVRSPHNRKERIILRPKGHYLQSGSTITTLVNTFAWLLCFVSMVDSHVTDLQSVQDTCLSCGYIVTGEECFIPEDITFLKYNPVKCSCHDEYQPVINLGVIFRASGTCRGDLPGRRSRGITERAKKFQSELMNGFTCKIVNPTLKLLNPGNSSKTVDYTEHISGLGDAHTFSDDALFKRYRFDNDSIESIRQACHESDVGSVVYLNEIGEILRRDYGLGLP